MPPPVPVEGAVVLEDDIYEPEQLILSDLINRVLDKGVVISSNITISIAGIELIQLDLRLLVSSVATLGARANLPVRSHPRP